MSERARAVESFFAVSLLFMARITFCMQRDENKPAGGGGGGGNGVLGGEGRRQIQTGEGKALVSQRRDLVLRWPDGRRRELPAMKPSILKNNLGDYVESFRRCTSRCDMIFPLPLLNYELLHPT